MLGLEEKTGDGHPSGRAHPLRRQIRRGKAPGMRTLGEEPSEAEQSEIAEEGDKNEIEPMEDRVGGEGGQPEGDDAMLVVKGKEKGELRRDARIRGVQDIRQNGIIVAERDIDRKSEKN